MDALDAGSVAYLEVLLQYGPHFFERVGAYGAEERSVRRLLSRALGGDIWKLKGPRVLEISADQVCVKWAASWNGPKWPGPAVVEALTEAKNPVAAMRKSCIGIEGTSLAGGQ